MASRRRDVVVGQPLSPAVLGRLGAASPFPAPSAGERPDGSWVRDYRIFTCHGYVNRDNDDHGFLRIERRHPDADGRFRLGVRQRILFTEGAVQEVEAELVCHDDRLASPESWTLAIEFLGPDGESREDLGSRETGRVDGASIEVERDGRVFRRAGSPRLVTDWGLLAALQRMPAAADEGFDLLEGLEVVKRDHRLRHRGVLTEPWAGDETTFDRFVQSGRGILPYEYYLDGARRPVIITTSSRAYILDAAAEAKTAAIIDRARAAARRRGR